MPIVAVRLLLACLFWLWVFVAAVVVVVFTHSFCKYVCPDDEAAAEDEENDDDGIKTGEASGIYKDGSCLTFSCAAAQQFSVPLMPLKCKWHCGRAFDVVDASLAIFCWCLCAST